MDTGSNFCVWNDSLLYEIENKGIFYNKKVIFTKLFSINTFKELSSSFAMISEYNDDYLSIKANYLINNKFDIIEASSFSFKKKIVNHFYSWNSLKIIEKTMKQNIQWQTDITNYGKYINLSNEDQPNEIDGDLMGFENLLFVPLRGGQLLALDVETGEKVWMLEQNISGQYAIIENKIYKKNRILYEIDAISGQVIQQKENWDGFISAGPIWAYEDILIIVNILEGDVILLDRKTFEIKDKINIGSRMAHSTENIIWHDNKLYVLDLNNTLHIFEKDW